MASAIKICRVCGKEYEACRSASRAAGVFRWQEVACSPECGAVYLKRINESRTLASGNKASKEKALRHTAEAVAEILSKPADAEFTVANDKPAENG